MKILLFAACLFLPLRARAADLEKAKTDFAAKCASCHGKDGKGSPAMAKMFNVPPAALDLTQKEIAAKKGEDLEKIIADGKGKMPKYGGKLTPEAIKDLVKLIQSWGPRSAP